MSNVHFYLNAGNEHTPAILCSSPVMNQKPINFYYNRARTNLGDNARNIVLRGKIIGFQSWFHTDLPQNFVHQLE